MTLTERDRGILVLLPAVLAAGIYVWACLLPGLSDRERLRRRLEAAGNTAGAWVPRIAAAERDRSSAEEALAAERARFAAGMKELRRQQPSAASDVRTKPGALAALNRSVSASGAKIVAATTGERRADATAGTWNVTFLATYDEMRKTLHALSEEPGVLVRRIDRVAAEDAGAKPIWKLIVEM
ncbi:MAG: hypothetical protein J6T01_00110 [Kiritimatiellae bacterium]|nr:hypothetical protein [Kiritimatiellia bacterium]